MPSDNSNLPTEKRFRLIQLPSATEWGTPQDILEDAAARPEGFAGGLLIVGYDADGVLHIASCNSLTRNDQIVLLMDAIDEVRNPTGG